MTKAKSKAGRGATSTRKTGAPSRVGDSDLVSEQGDRLTLESIEWYDHWSPGVNGWISNEEVPEAAGLLVHSVGWVLNETDAGVYVVSTITEADNHHSGMFILKSAMRKRERL